MKYIPVLQPGEIEEDRPMPSLNHSIVCQNIGGLLFPLREKISIHQQLNLNLDGWATIPDLCVYPRGVLHPDWSSDLNEVTVAPSLVVEVLSPMQILQPLIDKVRDYLRHGVNSCWIVTPGLRTVTLFPANGPSRTVTEGIVRDDVLEFELRVEDIFS